MSPPYTIQKGKLTLAFCRLHLFSLNGGETPITSFALNGGETPITSLALNGGETPTGV